MANITVIILMAVARFLKGGMQNIFQEQVQYQQTEFCAFIDCGT